LGGKDMRDYKNKIEAAYLFALKQIATGKSFNVCSHCVHLNDTDCGSCNSTENTLFENWEFDANKVCID
jgi:hypothetical protein